MVSVKLLVFIFTSSVIFLGPRLMVCDVNIIKILKSHFILNVLYVRFYFVSKGLLLMLVRGIVLYGLSHLDEFKTDFPFPLFYEFFVFLISIKSRSEKFLTPKWLVKFG